MYKFVFQIKDINDSIYHQMEFFQMGYSWVAGRIIIHEKAKYLFLDPTTNQISWNNRLSMDSDYVICKLVQPKQLEFLREINKIKLKKHKPIDFAIRYNCYKIDDSKYLNDLRDMKILGEFVTDIKNKK
jgi:hypothetical protein